MFKLGTMEEINATREELERSQTGNLVIEILGAGLHRSYLWGEKKYDRVQAVIKRQSAFLLFMHYWIVSPT